MNSFNAYGQTEKRFGGNVPVWLGTVKPIPVGAVCDPDKGILYKAGTPVLYHEDRTCEFLDNVANALADANGYLYNDIYSEEGGRATAAVVMYHAEGLLIERVLPEITEEQIVELQNKIPGVLLVRG